MEFDEHDEQWFLTLYSHDGAGRLGQPFMASAHPNNPKNEQIRRHVQELGYEITSVLRDAPNGTHVVVEVKPK